VKEESGVKMHSLGFVLSLLCVTLAAVQAKICWEECPGNSVIEHIDIEGCHRRSTYPALQDFRCEGRTGPPCTVIRGETVTINVKWRDAGHSNLTQSVYWQSGFFDLPWVGMDTQICKYVNDGTGCPYTPEEPEMSEFEFPIKIMEVYPAGYYKLKWSLIDRTDEGDENTAACFLVIIKIV